MAMASNLQVLPWTTAGAHGTYNLTGSLGPPQDDEIISAFKRWDKDNSGFIDVAEYKAEMKKYQFSDDDLDRLFKKVDMRADGRLYKDEFANLVRMEFLHSQNAQLAMGAQLAKDLQQGKTSLPTYTCFGCCCCLCTCGLSWCPYYMKMKSMNAEMQRTIKVAVLEGDYNVLPVSAPGQQEE